MKIKKEDLPVIMEAPGTTMRAKMDCGDISIGYNVLPRAPILYPY